MSRVARKHHHRDSQGDSQMGPTPDQQEALKNHVNALNDVVNNSKAVDWQQVAAIIQQLIALIFSSHVTK